MSPHRCSILKTPLFAACAVATSLMAEALRAQDCQVVSQIVNPAVCASGYGLFQLCPGQQPRLISCRRVDENPGLNPGQEVPAPGPPSPQR
jgi:hypothetical protein